jgi:hypothetical protein
VKDQVHWSGAMGLLRGISSPVELKATRAHEKGRPKASLSV